MEKTTQATYNIGMKKLRAPILSAFFMLALFVFIHFSDRSTTMNNSGLLRVVFLDVGQGDAIFIETPNGTQVLIDGGRGDSILRELGRVLSFFDKDIDMVVATHPDQDHIGGLIDVLERYSVHTIVRTENIHKASAAEAFEESVDAEDAEVMYARRGDVYDLGEGVAGDVILTILFPDHDPTNLESNTASIVARLTYGETEYLFTGDSPKEIEEYLVLLEDKGLKSDVLKVGHHGSRTSTSEKFLQAVSPKIAIISAGKDNTYGHPHKEVVDMLTKNDIVQKNTADVGSIFSVSNGTSVWFQ